jgi:hypothetical protein
MSARSYSFTHAVTRAPGTAVTQGLRDVDTGEPDLRLFHACPKAPSSCAPAPPRASARPPPWPPP